MEDIFVTIYAALVFLTPWLIYCWQIIRALAYAQRSGIPIFARGARARVRLLNQTDPVAANLDSRIAKWMKYTILAWLIGFVVLGIIMAILHLPPKP